MKIVKFKLQNLILDSGRELENYWNLMYRGSQGVYDALESVHVWQAGDFAEFFTYFNGFALKKWLRYSNAEKIYLELRCRGDFTIRLFGHFREGSEIRKEFYDEYVCHLPELKDIQIPIPAYSHADVVGFQFEAFPDGEGVSIESGGWYASVPASLIRDVRITIATTTYRRETYISRNVERMEREFFYSGESAAPHFRMKIVDNGQTLQPEEFNSEFISVYPNPNVGGAGGFTRGMLEALNDPDFSPTHVLLMDDDVQIMPEAFVRTWTLLSIIKPEYDRRFISGAMLKTDNMNIQHEDVGYVDKESGAFYPNKPEMDMAFWLNVFLNDEEQEFREYSYAAWWYCCIPRSVIERDSLPLPLFIRGDDVEFSLSHKAEFITLGGICVWHDSFARKFTASLEYYQVYRNSLVIQAASGICDEADFYPRIERQFHASLCKMAYEECDLILDAIEDFVNGPDFLLSPQGEKIMKEHAKKNEKYLPLAKVYSEDIGDPYRVYAPAERRFTEEEEEIYDETWNGHTLPACMLKKDSVAVIAYDWFDDPPKQYLAERILAVNPHNGTASMRKRDKKRFQELLSRYERLTAYYEENHEKIEASYREAAKTMKTEDFWREYLNLAGERVKEADA